MNRFKIMTWAAALALILLVAGQALAGDKYDEYKRGDALISVDELKSMIDKGDKDLVLIAVMKPVNFKLGYIPGSLNVWRPDYEPKKGEPYPYGGMMLNQAEFQSFARKLGVNNDSKVVVYDEKYDATRLWWGFYMYGKTDVRVLDGGLQAWKAAGYDTDKALFNPSAEETGNFTAKARNDMMIASMTDVWQAKSGAAQVWDTREEKEWTGAELKKGAFRKGRVPWAEFQNWKQFKMKVEGEKNPTLFAPAAEIKKVVEKYGMDPNKKQIFYCQSGVRTTTNMFALYLIGWDPSVLANYDGSWIEWSFHEKNPLVVDEG